MCIRDSFFKYANPAYDGLIEKAIKETDETVRAEYYKECQKILTEDAAAVWICDPNLTVASRKDLRDIPSIRLDLWTLARCIMRTDEYDVLLQKGRRIARDAGAGIPDHLRGVPDKMCIRDRPKGP